MNEPVLYNVPRRKVIRAIKQLAGASNEIRPLMVDQFAVDDATLIVMKRELVAMTDEVDEELHHRHIL